MAPVQPDQTEPARGPPETALLGHRKKGAQPTGIEIRAGPGRCWTSWVKMSHTVPFALRGRPGTGEPQTGQRPPVVRRTETEPDGQATGELPVVTVRSTAWSAVRPTGVHGPHVCQPRGPLWNLGGGIPDRFPDRSPGPACHPGQQDHDHLRAAPRGVRLLLPSVQHPPGAPGHAPSIRFDHFETHNTPAASARPTAGTVPRPNISDVRTTTRSEARVGPGGTPAPSGARPVLVVRRRRTGLLPSDVSPPRAATRRWRRRGPS